MVELVEGQIYKLKNGELKKLIRIEDKYLSYAVRISRNEWINLGRTYRSMCEKDFTEAEPVVMFDKEIWIV